ncbi:MAG: chemotaxis response regulator protein-glutamate methylesterase [Spirochaetales bacterium]|nr:chemotaxis response regulator protein-glutamate methylesterase [Spirochaetales bacterium]
MSAVIKVLIVDDSSLMRKLISSFFEKTGDVEVVGTAMNGRFALQKAESLAPDVIILDIEMPEMNGIEFLKEKKRRGLEVPVIILSSHAERGAKVTMEAIAAGAQDFLLKPQAESGRGLPQVADQLLQLVRIYGRLGRHGERPLGLETEAPAHQAEAVAPLKKRIPLCAPGTIEVIAIGISTGGPNALRTIFPKLRGDLGIPLLVVQHMPPGFTQEFALSLDRICPLEVKEAADGDIITAGRALIAPGDKHLAVVRKPLARVARLEDTEPLHGHKPSADVLFSSVAKVYGNHACALIMTGMGKDGAEAIGDIYEAGGITAAQDAESSVVYGMPKAAVGLGYIRRVLPLADIPDFLNRLNR